MRKSGKNGNHQLNAKGTSSNRHEAHLAIDAAQKDQARGGDGVVNVRRPDGSVVTTVSVHGDVDALAAELDDKR